MRRPALLLPRGGNISLCRCARISHWLPLSAEQYVEQHAAHASVVDADRRRDGRSPSRPDTQVKAWISKLQRLADAKGADWPQVWPFQNLLGARAASGSVVGDENPDVQAATRYSGGNTLAARSTAEAVAQRISGAKCGFQHWRAKARNW